VHADRAHVVRREAGRAQQFALPAAKRTATPSTPSMLVPDIRPK